MGSVPVLKREWIDGPQTRADYYKVDTLDVSIGMWALDSTGFVVPTLNWEDAQT